MDTGIADEEVNNKVKAEILDAMESSTRWTTKSVGRKSDRLAHLLMNTDHAPLPGRHNLSTPTAKTVGYCVGFLVTLDCATGTCCTTLKSLPHLMPKELAEQCFCELRHSVPDWGNPHVTIEGVTQPALEQSQRDVRMPTQMSHRTIRLATPEDPDPPQEYGSGQH